jgi:hypothetical protein
MYPCPWLRLAVLPAAVLLSAGCDPPGRPDPRIAQIQELEDRLADHARTIAQRDRELATQAEMIRTLRGLQPEERLDQLVRVARIELASLSGGYDDDRDGADEGVVLYLRTLDADGDVIKAAGSARVRLLDLSHPDGGRTVAAREWTSQELRGAWYGRLMTAHYTLRIPWAGGARNPPAGEITAVAEFTDLLTGQSFRLQHVVQARGAATSQPALAPSR